jgi:hypothetical protein
MMAPVPSPRITGIGLGLHGLGEGGEPANQPDFGGVLLLLRYAGQMQDGAGKSAGGWDALDAFVSLSLPRGGVSRDLARACAAGGAGR